MNRAANERDAKITAPAEREIRIERIFNAPRDRVWKALTDPALIAKWWGRGNKLVIERMEPHRGGHWRFVEHGPGGVHGFEGRYREVTPPERVVQTFAWDGMPGHVAVETMTMEDLGDGRTRLVTISLFHTTEERDGMRHSDMEKGLGQSYATLDEVLVGLARDRARIPRGNDPGGRRGEVSCLDLRQPEIEAISRCGKEKYYLAVLAPGANRAFGGRGPFQPPGTGKLGRRALSGTPNK